MNFQESTPLINKPSINPHGLTTIFAVICILDVFGVFPVTTLPKAIVNCGFYGIGLIFLVCSIQIYTANLLGKCWLLSEKIWPGMENKSRYPYGALAEVTYGKKLSVFATFLLDLTIFGGGIPNLIVASYNLQLVGEKISNNEVNISYCYWIALLGMILCPVLWLGSPKDMKVLCCISVLTVLLVFLFTCTCLLLTKAEENVLPKDDNIVEFPWKSILKAYGIITFQYDIHPTVLTIQVDMKDKSNLSKAVIYGFSISLAMFSITTLISYLKFGDKFGDNILETLPATFPLYLTAILVAIQLCLTSAISNSALYQQMEECMSISRSFNTKRCILRTTLTVMSIVIAELVPKFDLVMSLIGGTLTGPLVFILPPMIYLKLTKIYVEHQEILFMDSFANTITSDDNNEVKIIKENFVVNKIICILIIIFSVAITSCTTFVNFLDMFDSYSNLTAPCIYNVTMALLYL